MEKRTIIGVDVSKMTLDSAFSQTKAHLKIPNSPAGFTRWLKWALSLSTTAELWVVMEHTGYYSFQFELFLQQQAITYSKVPAIEIKRSAGLVRGKSDKADAQMISEYGRLRQEQLKAVVAPIREVTELKDLLSLRGKLVADRSGYKARLKEMRGTRGYAATAVHVQVQQHQIQTLSVAIKTIEKAIKEQISQDQGLSANYKLLLTIKGIGPVTAAYMLACTENFSRFANSRKFSCYAGLAPFEHSSGSSIRGKQRVSHYANKKAKCLLNLSALVAVRFNPELKAYYQKRVAEGKNKMSVLNIVRNKLVDRMFAVIKRQTPYCENLQTAA
jgi:transposase